MHLLARVIDRGTRNRSTESVAEDLDNRGITLTIGVTRHLFSLACTCLAEDFDAVFSLLGDIVLWPALPENELATRKAEVITAIRQDDDNPAVRAMETLMARLYPGHPYGQRSKGTPEVVERLTRDGLLALHRERFAPGQLSAVVVGDVAPARAADAAARLRRLVGAAAGGRAVPPVVRASSRARVVVPMPGKAQADVAYGFTAVTRSDPSYYAASLMNNIFGQYSMGGRLGDNIRERQGMAYYVFSSLDANVAEGPLTVRAGVSAENVDRAVAAIDGEVGRLARDGATARELAESQQYLVGSMPRALETNAAIAVFLQSVEFFDLGLDYDLRLTEQLRAVTLEEVNETARRLLDPDRRSSSGPYESVTA